MSWFGGIAISIIAFMFGRIFNQSEAVLAEKRRVYEAFLAKAPSPEEAYEEWTEELFKDRAKRFQDVKGPLLLYASPNVVIALSVYIKAFGEADEELFSDSPPLHPKYKAAAKVQNDLILEMKRDALGWSVFGYRGKTRLPVDALENAKKNSL